MTTLFSKGIMIANHYDAVSDEHRRKSEIR